MSEFPNNYRIGIIGFGSMGRGCPPRIARPAPVARNPDQAGCADGSPFHAACTMWMTAVTQPKDGIEPAEDGLNDESSAVQATP